MGFSFGDDTHAPSFLLQLCRSNLEDAIDDMDDIEHVCAIFEICSAMEAVHAANLIHRDLKPANILIDENGHVRVSDFGLSCYVDVKNQRKSQVEIKTTCFMAPELLESNSNAYSNKVDVYSFGSILFFILTGGKTPNISMKNQIAGNIAKIPKNINKIANKLISSCWSFNPNDRPSFTEIIDTIKSNDFKLTKFSNEDIDEIKSFLFH